MTEYTTAQLEAWAGLGPWRAHETKWDVWDVLEVHAANASCDDDPIAHLYRVNPWPEGAGADAFRNDKTNAALIAAAPDLARLVLEKDNEIARLKAQIQDIKECWDWWQEDTYDRCSTVVDDAIRQAMKETSDE